ASALYRKTGAKARIDLRPFYPWGDPRLKALGYQPHAAPERSFRDTFDFSLGFRLSTRLYSSSSSGVRLLQQMSQTSRQSAPAPAVSSSTSTGVPVRLGRNVWG